MTDSCSRLQSTAARIAFAARVKRQRVVNACDWTNPIAEAMSYRRMELAGLSLTGTNVRVAELVKNWANPAGAVAYTLLT